MTFDNDIDDFKKFQFKKKSYNEYQIFIIIYRICELNAKLNYVNIKNISLISLTIFRRIIKYDLKNVKYNNIYF